MNNPVNNVPDNVTEGLPFTELAKVLSDSGIDTADTAVAAALEKLRHAVDAGEIILTRAILDETASTLDQIGATKRELTIEDLEFIAGGKISPITEYLAGTVGFVVGAAEECVTEFLEASKNLIR